MDIFSRTEEMLLTEKKNKLQIQSQMKRELNNLPKGSIVNKFNGFSEYCYLNYYCQETKKSVSKYICSAKDEDVISTIKEQIKRRKQMERELKILAEDLKAMDKMLDITQKRTNLKSLREKLESASAEQETNENQYTQIPSVKITKNKNEPPKKQNTR